MDIKKVKYPFIQKIIITAVEFAIFASVNKLLVMPI